MSEKCPTCKAPVWREGDRTQFDSSRYHMDAVKKLSEISALRGAVESPAAEVAMKDAVIEAATVLLGAVIPDCRTKVEYDNLQDALSALVSGSPAVEALND